MRAVKKKNSFIGENIEIVRTDKDCAEHRSPADRSAAQMTGNYVFPGVQVFYRDLCASVGDAQSGNTEGEQIIRIDHCREGRAECRSGDAYFYLIPEDISIQWHGESGYRMEFPFGNYQGISIRIDLKHTPATLSGLLDDVEWKPSVLADQFCRTRFGTVVRRKPELAHVFSELYDIPESIKAGYLKVKVMEILLYLTEIDPETDLQQKHCCSAAQVTLAKQVKKYVFDHIDRRVTISELAEQFGVSQTQIKTCFRNVYGTSVYKDTRTQKMKEAARLLLESDQTVLDIAGHFGYENGSKFASAFRNVIGVSPNEYRNAKK